MRKTTQETTPPSTASDSHDWKVSRSWRRMFLALVDADTHRARDAICFTAMSFAGLASSYAPESPLTAEATEAAHEVAECSACGYKALSLALSALRSTGRSPEDDLCDLLRARHPEPPPTFGKAGQYDRHKAGPYVPLAHRLVTAPS